MQRNQDGLCTSGCKAGRQRAKSSRAFALLTALTFLLSACGSPVTQEAPVTGTTLASQGGCAPINLAFTKPATASSTEQDWLRPANAVDDDTYRTRWSSEFNDRQWFQVDLGRSFYVCNVVLKWEDAAAYGQAYEIQVSDDAQTWTPIYRTTGRKGGTDTLAPAGNVAGRYVRMQGVKRGNSYGYSLYDFQVYPAGGDVTEPPPPAPTTYTGNWRGTETSTYTWEPGEAGFSYAGGTLSATLTHDSTFSLFLQRQQGLGWVTVARDTGFDSTNPSNIKAITYEATSGIYRWQIFSTGSGGDYSLAVTQR